MSLPKTTPVFEIDEAARINKKQVCKQDVFRFFYKNFGSFPFPPLSADLSPPIEAVLPVYSFSVTERQINFYFPKDLVSHEIHQNSRKNYKKQD